MSRLKKVPWYLRYQVGNRMASDLRRMSVVAFNRHCHIEFQGPVRCGPGFSLEIPEHGSFIVGPGVDFRRGFVCEISGEGRVSIGGGSIFTRDTLIQCSTSIDIGPRCVFGQNTMMVDGAHGFGAPNTHMLDQGYDYRPLVIGEGAVVMSKCTIFADIGPYAFIGAHSVVSRPIPGNCLAIGTPAKPMRHFEENGVGSENGTGSETEIDSEV